MMGVWRVVALAIITQHTHGDAGSRAASFMDSNDPSAVVRRRAGKNPTVGDLQGAMSAGGMALPDKLLFVAVVSAPEHRQQVS